MAIHYEMKLAGSVGEARRFLVCMHAHAAEMDFDDRCPLLELNPPDPDSSPKTFPTKMRCAAGWSIAGTFTLSLKWAVLRTNSSVCRRST